MGRNHGGPHGPAAAPRDADRYVGGREPCRVADRTASDADLDGTGPTAGRRQQIKIDSGLRSRSLPALAILRLSRAPLPFRSPLELDPQHDLKLPRCLIERDQGWESSGALSASVERNPELL